MQETERTPLLGGERLARAAASFPRLSSNARDLAPPSAAAPSPSPPTASADVQILTQEEIPEDEADGSNSLDGPSQETLTEPATEGGKEDCVDGLLRSKAATEVAVRMRDPAASSFTSSDLGMGEGEEARAYWQRYWVLLLFSALAFFQCSMWSSWGPLNESVQAAYPNWGSSTVAMMANWGTLTCMGFVLVGSWFLHAFGLRVGVLTGAGMLALGTALRTLTVQDVAFTALSNVCAVLVGLAGTMLISAPPMLAALWFPPTERTTATAMSLVANRLGTAGSYLESFFVRQPGKGVSPSVIKEEIRSVMACEAMIALILFMLTVAYFPPRPPSPPSITSAIPRLRYREAVRSILRNRDLMLLIIAFSIFASVPVAWMSVFNYSLKEIGFGQDEAKWIGLASSFSSALFGLVSSRLTDLAYGHVRASLLVLTFLSCSCFFWFFLMTWHTIPPVRWQVYASVAGGVSLNFAMSPLFVELAVEAAYPCPEVVVAGAALTLENAASSAFLFAFFFHHSSYNWVTFCLLASGSLCALPLLLAREDYARSTIDRADPSLSTRSTHAS
ncbi:solute carrier family 49 member 4-like isoform X2 [Penaeus japonicus]|uniref:solute carrier family 49 member 4-like isoform X2 n=1 Tax=Penaeus japonicus TaxID=27405 RepID=UPI001C70D85D|nr:solute carrier family 49 member 4-like isoform X2 [Penaeus japonicus]